MTEKWSAQQYRDHLAKQEKARNSKFGAIPTETSDGQKFRSQVEAAFYNKHRLLEMAGDVVKIEREIRFEFTVDGVFICDYYLDFRVTWKDGHIDHVDTKSTATITPLFKIKHKLMKALYDIDVIPVFWEDIMGKPAPKPRGKK